MSVDKSKATPRPWRVQDGWDVRGSNGERVALTQGHNSIETSDANAALIIEAVNSYDRNQAALKAAVELAEFVNRRQWHLGDAADRELATESAREVLRLAGKE